MAARLLNGAMVSVLLPTELAEQVRLLEIREFESRSNVIRRLLRGGLEALRASAPRPQQPRSKRTVV